MRWPEWSIGSFWERLNPHRARSLYVGLTSLLIGAPGLASLLYTATPRFVDLMGIGTAFFSFMSDFMFVGTASNPFWYVLDVTTVCVYVTESVKQLYFSGVGFHRIVGLLGSLFVAKYALLDRGSDAASFESWAAWHTLWHVAVIAIVSATHAFLLGADHS